MSVQYSCFICGVDLGTDANSDHHTLPFASMDNERMPVCDGCYHAFSTTLEETN